MILKSVDLDLWRKSNTLQPDFEHWIVLYEDRWYCIEGLDTTIGSHRRLGKLRRMYAVKWFVTRHAYERRFINIPAQGAF